MRDREEVLAALAGQGLAFAALECVLVRTDGGDARALPARSGTARERVVVVRPLALSRAVAGTATSRPHQAN